MLMRGRMRQVDTSSADDLVQRSGMPAPYTTATGLWATGWEDTTWILHTMWTRPDWPEMTTNDAEVLGDAIGDGAVVPDGIDEHELRGVVRGDLDRQTNPGAPWRRVPWSEVADRLAVDMAGRPRPPSWRWFPGDAWPVSPPAIGSIDAFSWRRLADLLAGLGTAGHATPVFAFYDSVKAPDLEPLLFLGPLAGVTDFVADPQPWQWLPNNLWPEDRSWFTLTDADLSATQVSGPRELIDRVSAHPELETLDWQRA